MKKMPDMIIFEKDEVVILPSESEWQEITTWEDDEKGWRVYIRKGKKQSE